MKTATREGLADCRRPIGKALAFGAISCLLYVGLYVWDDEILRWTTRGRWFFILPVVIAFVFSFFHGGFTGYFWEALGIWAKPDADKK